jgi:phytoene desaturase
VSVRYNTEVVKVTEDKGKVVSVTDREGNIYTGDIFVINADAAAFRGQILNRPNFSEKILDKKKWTIAPFTMYLGVDQKIPGIEHHNYFLGKNFEEYAGTVLKQFNVHEKAYYYVNVPSKKNPNTAPEGCESLFILCPVPDLRFRPDWSDREALADNIISDLSERIGFDIHAHLVSRTVLDPADWEKMFGLYRGSGLGLAHNIGQIGYFRPRNKDEVLSNLYYVGASTIPGTGLPMVIVSSKLTTERITNDHP